MGETKADRPSSAAGGSTASDSSPMVSPVMSTVDPMVDDPLQRIIGTYGCRFAKMKESTMVVKADFTFWHAYLISPRPRKNRSCVALPGNSRKGAAHWELVEVLG